MANYTDANRANFVRWKKISGTWTLTDLQESCLPNRADDTSDFFVLLEDNSESVQARVLLETGDNLILEDG